MSPSFVAYELDIPTAEAEASLDDLVRDSILEFDFDQDGDLYYRPGSAYRFEDEVPEPSPYHMPSGSAADGSAARPSRPARGGARRASSPQRFDGYASTAVAEPSPSTRRKSRTAGSSRTRARSASGHREYIPPASPRRSAHRKRASQHERYHAPAPEIGPNGCDGSVRPLEATPGAQSQGRAQQPAADSPWNEHRRHAGLRPHASDSTAMVTTSSDSRLPARKKRRGDPLLASFLSLLFVGSGQLYNGQFAKGVAFFTSFIVLWAFGLGWMVHIWAAVDAYQVGLAQQEVN